MDLHPQLLGYIGPETVLPATSILAAIGGFVLAFWQYISQAVVRAFRFVFRLPAPAVTPPAVQPPTLPDGAAP